MCVCACAALAGSTDKTIQYLSILRHSLERLGIAHNINSLPGDWRQFCDQIVDATQRIQCQTHGCTTLRSCPVWIRIPLMAAIRNMALLPLLNASSVREAASRLAGRTPVPPTVGEPSLNSPISPFAPFVGDPLDAARAHAAAEGSSGAAGDLPRATVQMQSLVGSTQHLGLPRPVRVVFLNDVILYAEDVLELIATHNGNYDMACAMDFERLKFYDTWVARDMSGSSFSDWYPFVREAVAQERLRQREPFRVFSCWNGAVVVPAHAITLNGILFRSWMPAELRSLRPRAPPENVRGRLLPPPLPPRCCAHACDCPQAHVYARARADLYQARTLRTLLRCRFSHPKRAPPLSVNFFARTCGKWGAAASI
ncbi:hypothetical protein EON62_03595 [archaeon]|nr:MAG: hypothetical protein EON62_03595 [archaeon]